MRIPLLSLALIGALAVTGCSSSTKDDDMFLGDRTNISEGPIEGQASSAYPTDGFEAQPTSMGSAVAGTMEDLIVNVGDRVYFGYDRYDLTPEALTQLQMQARWLQQYQSVSITVEGHADERGTREYNLALGDRRATSVKDYLVSLGVASSRISTISYGKEMPEVLGSNAQSWARNRRAVTKVN
jgi:peptidoglycan-associated lipoprotein